MTTPEQPTERKSGMKQLAAEEFDLAEAIGGVRGVIESVLPVIVFLGVYLPTHRLLLASGLALLAATIALVARLLARTPITQALGGFLGVAICAMWAAYSGSAEGYFAPGLVINAVYAAIMLISVLVRYPLIGLADGLIRGESNWRTSPRMPRYYAITLLWAAMFALRLGVQWPLYTSGNVAALGTARLLMGIPLFAVVIFISWLALRRKDPDQSAPEPAAPAAEIAPSSDQPPQ